MTPEVGTAAALASDLPLDRPALPDADRRERLDRAPGGRLGDEGRAVTGELVR